MPDVDSTTWEEAWRSRDPAFDGRFFIGVRTTGVYCRCVCPVRLPLRGNIEFLPSAAAAEVAGFRPCLRCRPEAAPFSPAWNGTRTTVEASRSIGARRARVQRAKRLLSETDLPMVEVAVQAGFGSLRRFNAVFAEVYKRPPGAIRRRCLPSHL